MLTGPCCDGNKKDNAFATVEDRLILTLTVAPEEGTKLVLKRRAPLCFGTGYRFFLFFNSRIPVPVSPEQSRKSYNVLSESSKTSFIAWKSKAAQRCACSSREQRPSSVIVQSGIALWTVGAVTHKSLWPFAPNAKRRRRTEGAPCRPLSARHGWPNFHVEGHH